MKRRSFSSARRARRWTEREARGVLEELGRSGLPAVRFAAERGLGVERLLRWKRRLQAEADSAAKGPRFAEVALPPVIGATIEVVLADGLVVRCAGTSRVDDAVAVLSRLTGR